MDIVLIIVAIVSIAVSHLIAKYIGEKREIGYGKSIFFSVVFSPIFGLLITLTSKKLADSK